MRQTLAVQMVGLLGATAITMLLGYQPFVTVPAAIALAIFWAGYEVGRRNT